MYIYFYRDKDHELIYVGSTCDVLQRFYQHQNSDGWMKEVSGVTIRGPYNGDECLEFEKLYISHFKPLYNKQSMDYKEHLDFRDVSSSWTFNSIDEFIDFYSAKPDSLQRSTYYLRLEDIEVLRILRFLYHEDASALVRTALGIGFAKLARNIDHADIYQEARHNIRGRKKNSAQYKFTDM